jgi:hypothetical protein
MSTGASEIMAVVDYSAGTRRMMMTAAEADRAAAEMQALLGVEGGQAVRAVIARHAEQTVWSWARYQARAKHLVVWGATVEQIVEDLGEMAANSARQNGAQAEALRRVAVGMTRGANVTAEDLRGHMEELDRRWRNGGD